MLRTHRGPPLTCVTECSFKSGRKSFTLRVSMIGVAHMNSPPDFACLRMMFRRKCLPLATSSLCGGTSTPSGNFRR